MRCVSLGTSRPDRLLSSIQKKKKVLQRWMDCRVLVIDEISMVDPDLLELLDFLAKKLKNNNKPFGGIQVSISENLIIII
jgi:ATP-dependent DNA helicase PIF1